jgi:hypothetical protein
MMPTGIRRTKGRRDQITVKYMLTIYTLVLTNNEKILIIIEPTTITTIINRVSQNNEISGCHAR